MLDVTTSDPDRLMVPASSRVIAPVLTSVENCPSWAEVTDSPPVKPVIVSVPMMVIPARLVATATSDPSSESAPPLPS